MSRSRSGYSSLEQGLELGDRGPLDRLAGDRALEDVVRLVLGVERQLEVVAVEDVDVGEDPLLVVLDDPLELDVVLDVQLVEGVGHQREAVAEDVDVDVGALADVPGQDAADQPRPEPGQELHEPQGVEPHVEQVLEPLGALVHPGHGLDLVADLLVAGQVAGPMAILDAELLGGLALGGEVLGLGPAIHHLGGQEGDLAPDAFISHVRGAPILSPSKRRGASVRRADLGPESDAKTAAGITARTISRSATQVKAREDSRLPSFASIARIIARNRRFEPE